MRDMARHTQPGSSSATPSARNKVFDLHGVTDPETVPPCLFQCFYPLDMDHVLAPPEYLELSGRARGFPSACVVTFPPITRGSPRT